MKLVIWFEHGQVCKRSRKRKQIDNQIKYFTRSWPLHKQIEKLLTESLAKIPDVTVTDHNPKILDTFQMNPENPFVAPQRVQGNAQLDLNEEEEPAQHNGRIIAMPYGNSRTKGSQYGDLKIVTSFPGDIQKAMIIDVSVGSTHAASNLRHTINADKYSSGLADYGALLKDQKHAHYIHDGNAIGFTLDSMGGISNAALKFTNFLYAKGSGTRRRRWDSDCMRIAPKKKFLDSLSSVLCHHRVLDFIYPGYTQ